jgi:hypothetical protein
LHFVSYQIGTGGEGKEGAKGEEGEGEGEGADMGRNVYGAASSSSSMQAAAAAMEAEVGVVPAYPDATVPGLEWWDEVFLPRERREARRLSKAAHLSLEEDEGLLALTHARTHRLVQHPVPLKPLGGERLNVMLPMYLTKHEQKKLRRTSRQEKEQEKRDKMMMGLIPAPEPKFKLSNFMKLLGDQAVADPSKVEARVLQQMQQRVLSHEMRNQASKLTPEERKEKRTRKLQEDVSRSVCAALFRVKDFSSSKHRFQVDVNAQQHFLSGIGMLGGFYSAVRLWLLFALMYFGLTCIILVLTWMFFVCVV